MRPAAAAAAAASFLRHTLLPPPVHPRQQNEPPPDAANQTVLYLALGALVGVAYSLGTEKYMRAMQHRHIFVRNAMLWLSAVAWLIAAAAVAWVASLIYTQVGGGLEGFDRVLGVLIPFVVRADLVVDWARRVAWALLNMATWTQSAVQVRRLLGRAAVMRAVVAVDDDVEAMARVERSRQADLLSSEDRVWTEDADSLVRVADVLQHFEKLGRVAVYALGGLLGAVPGAVVWILYAAYHGAVSFTSSMYILGSLYWISIFLAPVGAVVLVIASTGLLCGVVTLSIVGTVIQFSVYWSTRTVYSMVRIAMSQAWAGFPDITKPHAMPNVQLDPPGPNAGPFAIKAVRHPEEAGAAIAQMGSLLPTELEFALASWDGFHSADNVKPAWLSRKLFEFNFFKTSRSTAGTEQSEKPVRTSQKAASNGTSGIASPPKRMSSARDAEGMDAMDLEDACSENDTSRDPAVPSQQLGNKGGVKDNDNETALILLGRLGLDLSVKSARKRRLSTYYALGMLAHLQVESGGNALRLYAVAEFSDTEFEERITTFHSMIADEAQIALAELATRLRGCSKYRVIPTGAPNSKMVPVTVWLRSTLLAFLETPSESDGGRGLRETSTP